MTGRRGIPRLGCSIRRASRKGPHSCAEVCLPVAPVIALCSFQASEADLVQFITVRGNAKPHLAELVVQRCAMLD